MKRNNVNHLADDVQEATKVVGKVVKAVKGAVSGVRDDRFIEERDRAVQILRDAGYTGNTGDYVKYKIDQAQIPNKADNYKPYFIKLFAYLRDRMNKQNPGLGDYWIQTYPLIMANKGVAKRESISAIKDLVQTYPPGTYKPTFEQATKTLAQTKLDSQSKGYLPSTSKEQIEDQNSKRLKPLVPLMSRSLSEAGQTPAGGTADIADQFYEFIVKPATQEQYETDHLDDAVTNSILEFFATIQAKALAGELPKGGLYDKMANASFKLQERLQGQVKTQAGNKIGNFIMENPLLAVGAAVLAGIIIIKLAK